MFEDNFDFDLDLDNFDLDSASGEGEFKSTNKVSKAREAVITITGGFSSGIKESLFTRSAQEKIISKSLPKEYRVAYDKAVTGKDAIADIYDTAVEEANRLNDGASRAFKPLIDKYSSRMPNRIKAALSKWANKSQPIEHIDQENREELEAVAAINDIFNKQQQTEHAKQSRINTAIGAGIAKSTNELTKRILGLHERQLSYSEQIDSAWKRKTLELQYKQFFVQRKTLDVNEKMLSLQENYLASIEKNTALPDIIKMQNKEYFSHLAQTRLYQDLTDGFTALPKNVSDRLKERLKTKIKSAAQNSLTGIETLTQTIVDMDEMSSLAAEFEDKNSALRSNASSLGNFATEPLINFIFGRQKVKELTRKVMTNDKVRSGATRLNNMLVGGDRRLNSVLRGNSESQLLNTVMNFLGVSDIAQQNSVRIANSSSNDLDSPAYFDMLTRKSITEIIPGLLSRIHGEIHGIRTGAEVTDNELLHYDHKKNAFLKLGKIKKDIRSQSINPNDKVVMKENFDKVIDILKLGDVSDEAKKLMFNALSHASITGDDFNLSTIRDHGLRGGTPEQVEEIMASLEKNFGIERSRFLESQGDLSRVLFGRMGDNRKAQEAQRAIYDVMNTIQSSITNPSKTISGIHKLYGPAVMDVFSDFVHMDSNGGYNIDFAAYNDMLNRTEDTPVYKQVNTSVSEERRQLLNNEISKLVSSQGRTVKHSEQSSKQILTDAVKEAFNDVVDSKAGQKTSQVLNQIKENVSEAASSVPDIQVEEKIKEIQSLVSKNPKLMERIHDAIGGLNFKLRKPSILDNVRHSSNMVNFPDEVHQKFESSTKKIEHKLLSRFSSLDNSLIKRVKNKFSFDRVVTQDEAEILKNADPDRLRIAANQAQGELFARGIDDPDGSIKSKLMVAMLRDSKSAAESLRSVSPLASGFFNDMKISDEKNTKEGGVLGTAIDIIKMGLDTAHSVVKPGMVGLKFGAWLTKKIVGAAKGAVDSFVHIKHGLWIPGERRPRLLRSGLLSGRYAAAVDSFGEKLKTINKPDDITGDIYDVSGNEPELLVTKEELQQGLYDSSGKLIFQAPSFWKQPLRWMKQKVGGLLSKVIGKGVRLGGKALEYGTKGYLKSVKGIVRVATAPITGFMNFLMNEPSMEAIPESEILSLGLEHEQNAILKDIRDIVHDFKQPDHAWNDNDQDGDRDGSAADVFQNRLNKKDDEKDTKDGVKEDKKNDGILGKLASMMGGVLSKVTAPFAKMFGAGGALGSVGSALGAAGAKMKGLGSAMSKLPGWAKLLVAIPIMAGIPAGTDENGQKENLLKQSARWGIKLADAGVDMGIDLVAGTSDAIADVANWMGRQAVDKINRSGAYLINSIPNVVEWGIEKTLGKKAKNWFARLTGNDTIDPLFRFRMAQYGFEHKGPMQDDAAIMPILKFEADLLSDLIPGNDSGKRAAISDKHDLATAMAYWNVGIDSERDVKAWTTWFAVRFRPVFLSYVTHMYQIGLDGKRLHELDGLLGKQEKLKFIEYIDFKNVNPNPYNYPLNPLESRGKLDYRTQEQVAEVREDMINEIKSMPDDGTKQAQRNNERAKKRVLDKTEDAQKALEMVNAPIDRDQYHTAKILKNIKNAKMDWLKNESMLGASLGFKQDKETLAANQTKLNNIAATFGSHEAILKQSDQAALKAVQSNTPTSFDVYSVGQPAATALTAQAVTPKPVSPSKGGSVKQESNGATGFGAFVSSLFGIQSAYADTRGYDEFVTGVEGPALNRRTKNKKVSQVDGSTISNIADKPLKAASYAAANAAQDDLGKSAKYIREALTAAGYKFDKVAKASEYPSHVLPQIGFVKLAPDTAFMAGDIMVFDETVKHKNGHIQIYNGANWISDHIQESWNPFLSDTPPFTVWRDVNFATKGSLAKTKVYDSIESVASDSKDLRKQVQSTKTNEVKSKSKDYDKSDESHSDKKEKGFFAGLKKLFGRDKDSSTGANDSWRNVSLKSDGSSSSSSGYDYSSSSTGTSGGEANVSGNHIRATRNLFIKYCLDAGKPEQNIKMILAKMHTETGGFKNFTGENMNYSTPSRIATVFRRHFGGNAAAAAPYANNPEKLANKVYGSENGNRGEASGDGWRYRGRSLIGITFRGNYDLLGRHIGVDLVNDPDKLNTPDVGAKACLAYFDKLHPKVWNPGTTLAEIVKAVGGSSFAGSDTQAKYDSIYKNCDLRQLMTEGGGPAASPTQTTATGNTSSGSSQSSTTSSATATKTGLSDKQRQGFEDAIKKLEQERNTAQQRNDTNLAKAKETQIKNLKKQLEDDKKASKASSSSSTGISGAVSTSISTVKTTSSTSSISVNNGSESVPANANTQGLPEGVKKMVDHAVRNARGSSIGACARYVRQAWEAGGFVAPSRQGSAYQYHENKTMPPEFVQISAMTPWQVGDIWVINRFGLRRHGHIQIYAGSQGWVSDFKQPDHTVYSSYAGGVAVYRHKDCLSGATMSNGSWDMTFANGPGPQPTGSGSSGSGGVGDSSVKDVKIHSSAARSYLEDIDPDFDSKNFVKMKNGKVRRKTAEEIEAAAYERRSITGFKTDLGTRVIPDVANNGKDNESGIVGGGQTGAPWMDIAMSLEGKGEQTDEKLICEIFEVGCGWKTDKISSRTPWCATFVNYCLKQAGAPMSGKPSALSFAEYGQSLNTKGKYPYGAIFTWRRSGGGHTGFVIEDLGDTFKYIAGNEATSGGHANANGAVRIRVAAKSKVYSLSFPEGYSVEKTKNHPQTQTNAQGVKKSDESKIAKPNKLKDDQTSATGSVSSVPSGLSLTDVTDNRTVSEKTSSIGSTEDNGPPETANMLLSQAVKQWAATADSYSRNMRYDLTEEQVNQKTARHPSAGYINIQTEEVVDNSDFMMDFSGKKSAYEKQHQAKNAELQRKNAQLQTSVTSPQTHVAEETKASVSETVYGSSASKPAIANHLVDPGVIRKAPSEHTSVYGGVSSQSEPVDLYKQLRLQQQQEIQTTQLMYKQQQDFVNRELATSNDVLHEQLSVQKAILQTLTKIDDGVIKTVQQQEQLYKVNQQQLEQQQTLTQVTQTQGNSQTQGGNGPLTPGPNDPRYQVQRAGKREPMSMRKTDFVR